MKNKYKHFLVGLCDENFKELPFDSYTRIAIPYISVVIEKELFGAKKIYFKPNFSFNKDALVYGYILFSNNGEQFAKKANYPIMVGRWSSLIVDFNIIFPDKKISNNIYLNKTDIL